MFIQLATKGGEQATEIDYSLYDAQLTADNISRVTIIGGKEISGEFKNRVLIQGRDTKQFNDSSPIANSEGEVQRLRDKQVSIKAEEPRVSIASVLISILPWIIIFGIWIFLFRQMQSGGNKAFSFGKSKAKLLSGDTPKVTFADVAGADEAKVELREIIEFLKDPAKFTKLGGRLPKGALLVGPPGTGKTLLARAVAGEAARPFFSMSGSDFVEMFVGVGASRVRDLFEQGKASAPCIIFIDEIDAVGRHRGAGLGGGHDEREQTLNQLLVEMDGFESNEGVILIAATNRPDVLDPALLRPGRFDRQIVVDAPDLRGREGILKVHVRNKPLADDVEIHKLARGTPGMAGADLANLVNEAALLAARRNHDKIYMVDFEDAKDRVMLGAERKSLVMKEEERRLTAFHEGGPRRLRDPREGERSAAQGHDRAARPCARSRLHAPRGRPRLGDARAARGASRDGVRRSVRRGADLRARPRDDGGVERHPVRDRPRAALRLAVGALGRDRADPRGRQRAGGLPRARTDEPSHRLRAHGAAGGRRGLARDQRGVQPRDGHAHLAPRPARPDRGGAARARDAHA